MSDIISDIIHEQEHISTLNDMYYTVSKLGYTASYSLYNSNMGLESINTITSTEMALESIREGIKNHLIKWSAKILTFIKNSTLGLSKKFSSLMTSTTNKLATIKKGSYNTLKSTKEYVKAHPYKTAAIAVATIATLFGIIGFATGSFPIAGSRAVVTSYLESVATKINKLKSPLCNIKTTILNGSTVKAEIIGTVPDVLNKTANDLGWTKSNAESFMNTTQSMMDSMNKNWDKFEKDGMNTTKKMESSIASLLGRESYDDQFEETDLLQVFLNIIKTIYYVTKAILVICWEVISRSLSTLSWLYTSSNSIRV